MDQKMRTKIPAIYHYKFLLYSIVSDLCCPDA